MECQRSTEIGWHNVWIDMHARDPHSKLRNYLYLVTSHRRPTSWHSHRRTFKQHDCLLFVRIAECWVTPTKKCLPIDEWTRGWSVWLHSLFSCSECIIRLTFHINEIHLFPLFSYFCFLSQGGRHQFITWSTFDMQETASFAWQIAWHLQNRHIADGWNRPRHKYGISWMRISI